MLKDIVFLSNTDTAIGFISQNREKLDRIKKRPSHKKYIKALNSLSSLKSFTRVPQKHKNRLRRSKKTTFIIKDESYRVVYDKRHLLLLDRLKWAYTSSANLSGDAYDEDFAISSADVVIYPLVKNTKSSTIYKIGKYSIKKIR